MGKYTAASGKCAHCDREATTILTAATDKELQAKVMQFLDGAIQPVCWRCHRYERISQKQAANKEG